MGEQFPDLLTTPEVAEILRIHKTRVSPLIRAGKLKAIDISIGQQRAVYRVKRSDLEEFIEKSKVEPWS